MFYTGVFDADTGDCLGKLVDIAHNGLMLAGPEAIERGRRCRLEVRLPVQIEGQERLRFDAEVMWSGAGFAPLCHETGFRYLAANPEGEQILERLFRDYALHDGIGEVAGNAA